MNSIEEAARKNSSVELLAEVKIGKVNRYPKFEAIMASFNIDLLTNSPLYLGLKIPDQLAKKFCRARMVVSQENIREIVQKEIKSMNVSKDLCKRDYSSRNDPELTDVINRFTIVLMNMIL